MWPYPLGSVDTEAGARDGRADRVVTVGARACLAVLQPGGDLDADADLPNHLEPIGAVDDTLDFRVRMTGATTTARGQLMLVFGRRARSAWCNRHRRHCTGRSRAAHRAPSRRSVGARKNDSSPPSAFGEVSFAASPARVLREHAQSRGSGYLRRAVIRADVDGPDRATARRSRGERGRPCVRVGCSPMSSNAAISRLHAREGSSRSPYRMGHVPPRSGVAKHRTRLKAAADPAGQRTRHHSALDELEQADVQRGRRNFRYPEQRQTTKLTCASARANADGAVIVPLPPLSTGIRLPLYP